MQILYVINDFKIILELRAERNIAAGNLCKWGTSLNWIQLVDGLGDSEFLLHCSVCLVKVFYPECSKLIYIYI